MFGFYICRFLVNYKAKHYSTGSFDPESSQVYYKKKGEPKSTPLLTTYIIQLLKSQIDFFTTTVIVDIFNHCNVLFNCSTHKNQIRS